MLLHAPRLIHAQQARIRGLSGLRILASGLAELPGRAYHIKNIIGDLKRKADGLPVAGKASLLCLRSAAKDRAQHDRRHV